MEAIRQRKQPMGAQFLSKNNVIDGISFKDTEINECEKWKVARSVWEHTEGVI